MKIFDKYILKSFLQPFLATFLVVLFVLVMQAVWLAFDEIAGKGINTIFILKFLWYLALILTPTALPIGILLSSIMALGNLSENYEFAAIKSSGISLKRIIRPLIILTLFLSVVNFVFMNNIYPWATLKQKNLYMNMKKKKPALALVPGVFNTEIPGYTIKFKEKYGEEENLLKDVQISDLSAGKGKIKVITAEKGEISSDEGSKYMTLTLENGNYYEEHIKSGMTSKEREKMPASAATFKTYTINIDISSFNDGDNLDDENYKQHHGMLTINQLDSISDVRKIEYDIYIENQTKSFIHSVHSDNLHKYPDTLNIKNLQPEILDNFNLNNKILVVDQALNMLKRIEDKNKNQIKNFKDRRKVLNLYDHEFSYRITFSLACLVLFFIGAPLGSIIRKGGFGLPMVMAIVVFVIYFFISQLGKNLAEESAISSFLGSWLSTIILLPFGILLTRRATEGMGIFNIDSVLDKIKNFFKKIKLKKT
ncbi:LptF/LptG family permease [Lutibacter sp. TH_r2]|uniref:LptF/LptG family permease n=1 Tax=Lutibacter sp. TH_r2 TaxID=3082083 RepID=UPI002955637D|nr:LptF/LptG family permease [Lutibacter sp. TH_r2]MDV7188073.1 LptF/LptG family permease [Lutibacter sp. TH_r2]